MKSRFWIVVLALVIPYVAIIGAFPFFNRAEPFILGLPFIYFWLFSWLPLTSLCMFIAYKMDPENEEEHTVPDDTTQVKGA